MIGEEGWCQGSYYGQHGGYCLLGPAFDKFEGTFAMDRYARALGFSDTNEATAWNDTNGRTVDEVLARLDLAIAQCAGV